MCIPTATVRLSDKITADSRSFVRRAAFAARYFVKWSNRRKWPKTAGHEQPSLPFGCIRLLAAACYWLARLRMPKARRPGRGRRLSSQAGAISGRARSLRGRSDGLLGRGRGKTAYAQRKAPRSPADHCSTTTCSPSRPFTQARLDRSTRTRQSRHRQSGRRFPVVADFLKNAAEQFGFVPDRPASDIDFKRAYAKAALAGGLTRDQIVGIYAFETGGNGAYDSQAGLVPYRPGARAISPAVGYNQLLSTNTVSLLAEDGNRYLARFARKQKAYRVPQRLRWSERSRASSA